ncbi:MAG: hypothetical protein WBD40_18025 [Tepidisphaeraceae bacterium]
MLPLLAATELARRALGFFPAAAFLFFDDFFFPVDFFLFLAVTFLFFFGVTLLFFFAVAVFFLAAAFPMGSATLRPPVRAVADVLRRRNHTRFGPGPLARARLPLPVRVACLRAINSLLP